MQTFVVRTEAYLKIVLISYCIGIIYFCTSYCCVYKTKKHDVHLRVSVGAGCSVIVLTRV